MLYLTMHSTHFILRLFGVRHMVKDHSDSEMKPAAATWATLSDQQQGFFYMDHPTDRIAHTTTWSTGWNERERERERKRERERERDRERERERDWY